MKTSREIADVFKDIVAMTFYNEKLFGRCLEASTILHEMLSLVGIPSTIIKGYLVVKNTRRVFDHYVVEALESIYDCATRIHDKVVYFDSDKPVLEFHKTIPSTVRVFGGKKSRERLIRAGELVKNDLENFWTKHGYRFVCPTIRKALLDEALQSKCVCPPTEMPPKR